MESVDGSATGDVHEEDFEAFRNAFNEAMIAAIDAQRGPGYFDRLASAIDARVNAMPVPVKTRR